ncbi:MAG: leucine-rich repeat domain-containing protein [Ruminococcaceae bacterium]|nr:leucine-rich repeat domain-containing protein [Oscillospiraceae bacterium]
MKKFFALLLALLLVCSLVACKKDETNDDDDFDMTVASNDKFFDTGGAYNDCYQYEIINGNEVAIIGFKSSYTPHEITVPAEIEKCPVVKIEDAAFYQCSQITVVNIPATVTEIGDMAFAGCVQMTAVKFAEGADNLTAIGDYAFSSCAKLSAISLPASLLTLGEGAFLQCAKLTSIALPEVVRDGETVTAGITAIKPMTFMGCKELAAVTGGTQITAIGDFAFCGTALTAYTVPATVSSVGANAFALCNTLATMTFVNATGWSYQEDPADKTLTGVDVSDAAMIAYLLRTDYASYVLVRA